jgi:hypothetical protein
MSVARITKDSSMEEILVVKNKLEDMSCCICLESLSTSYPNYIEPRMRLKKCGHVLHKKCHLDYIRFHISTYGLVNSYENLKCPYCKVKML